MTNQPPGNAIHTFGKNLKGIREEFTWTQERFARHLGVTRQSLASWEEGRAHPKIKLLLEICKKLKIKDIPAFVQDETFELKIAQSVQPGQGLTKLERLYCMLEENQKKAVDALLGI